MHNATTKQRLAALRRKLGIFSGAPRWVRERRARLARFEAAAATMLGFGRAAERAPEATPAPALAGGMHMLSAPLPGEASSSSRWVSTRKSAAATQPAPQEREVVPTPDLPPEDEVSSPRRVSASLTEPTTLEPSQQWTREAAPKTELVTTSDLVRDTSTSSPHQVSTSMIEPATIEPSQRWTRESAGKPALGTTSDLVRTGKTFPRPAHAHPGPSAEATEPTRRAFPRRAAALAAAALAAVVGLFLALRPRAPAPPERAPEVEAPTLPAQAIPAPAVAAPTREAAARPPAPASTAVVIRRGDTLWALAAAHLGDPMLWPKLHAANRDRIRDPDLIYPGQQIELPER